MTAWIIGLLSCGQAQADLAEAYRRSETIHQRAAGKTWDGNLRAEWSDGKLHFQRELPGQSRQRVALDLVSLEETPAPAGKAAPSDPNRRRRGDGNPRGEGFVRPNAVSPDGKTTAFLGAGGNVNLRGPDGKTRQISADATPDDAYDGRFFWSPDGQRLIAYRTKKGGDRKVTLVESSPKDQLQPKTKTINYLKPGDPIALTKPALFDVAAGKRMPVSDALFPNPWALSHERWDGNRFTFLYNGRGHTAMRIVALDAATGQATALMEEPLKTYFDYNHKQYFTWLPDGDFVWMSERDGWNHLYRMDGKTGAVRNRITEGAWAVLGVERLDAAAGKVWFRAGGHDPKQDPYHVHLGRADLAGGKPVWLTAGDGTHQWQWSPDRKHFVDTWSRVDAAPTAELRSADGKLLKTLARGTLQPLLDAKLPVAERFVSKGRDGTTDIWGVIVRPSHFDPAKKYPVIENIYAGPQGHFVPKSFRSSHGTMSALAELGFVVVQIDGMGTSGRSKSFHDVSWKNLGDGGFPDRILWLKAAAKERPWLDLTRVGIYGGSAGGQNALRGLLAHGDFYKACVADCGCHDNRMDKIWWNELYMSWPLGPHYEAASNVVHAGKLQGKLLLVVGELDDNVDPASTLQVAAALHRANKDFELLLVPGAGHGACETPAGQRKRKDFFVRSLLGAEPPPR